MRERFRFFITHPLFSGSAIMVLGTNFVSVLNYIYHFLMGRMLGPASYGELVSLFSLLGLLGMVPVAVNLAITKFVSAAKNTSEVHSMLVDLQKKVVYLMALGFVLSSIMAVPAAHFLQLSSIWNFIIVGLVFTLSLPVFINRAVMQGVLRFGHIVISLFVDNGLKLIGGVLLVYLGYSVMGALVALVIAGVISLGISFFFIRDFFKNQQYQKPDLKPFMVYSLPVFVHQLAITSMSSSDLILVKHFFNPTDAGIYSATSTLAKIIFYAASPVVSVMFPIVVQRYAQGKDYYKIFVLSFMLTALIAIFAALLFTFFAPLAVLMLFGKRFDLASVYLPPFSLLTILLTLDNLFIGFFLSINKTKVVILPLLAAIGQIVFILQFHQSLYSILEVSIFTTALLTLSLIVYSFYERRASLSYRTVLQTARHHSRRSKKNI